ncbi:MAG TPA: hypothetical protein VFF19_23145 [Reyranella sp.]|nr:hypothetical protein [Reyranella sp.]
MATIFDAYSGTPTFGGASAAGDISAWDFGGHGSFGVEPDYTSAPGALSGGITGWASDRAEQARMGQGYADNGLPWWDNFSAAGASRLIDSAVRGYAVVKGTQAATYAGQNGLTYMNGRGGVLSMGGGLLPLLLIGGALLLLTKK